MLRNGGDIEAGTDHIHRSSSNLEPINWREPRVPAEGGLEGRLHDAEREPDDLVPPDSWREYIRGGF
ncbi:MAG: hypothetical protein GF344_06900 [Chitinivibrionales bacterium]|nr:hypothetical protein [Chitinivibrionales bacterium]MBD3356648.1 hypothetical protein [Chitinivibrionales bacterium]